MSAAELRQGDGPYIAMADKWMVSNDIRDMILGARALRRSLGYFAENDAQGC